VTDVHTVPDHRWGSEGELLDEMASWEPLPDEDDPRWETDDATSGVWAQLSRLLAAAGAAGAQRWRRVAIEVFRHAASWDVHGAMLDLRHGPEQAFLDDGSAFARSLEPLTRSSRAGTRLWVARELGVLREVSSLPHLLQLLPDPSDDVAGQAQDSIDMLAQRHPEARRHESSRARHVRSG
jgi:hypothetical protein